VAGFLRVGRIAHRTSISTTWSWRFAHPIKACPYHMSAQCAEHRMGETIMPVSAAVLLSGGRFEFYAPLSSSGDSVDFATG